MDTRPEARSIPAGGGGARGLGGGAAKRPTVGCGPAARMRKGGRLAVTPEAEVVGLDPSGGARTRLEAVLQGIPSAMVAVSGGVDSAVVLAVAAQVVPRVVAASGTSVAYAAEDLAAARALAARLGVEHVEVPTRETTDPRYAVNAPSRCFHCKSELYGKLLVEAAQRGLAVLLDGAHAGDLGDFRPGMRAADALGVRSPLREAGLFKTDVRSIARSLGLPIWDKPASPCLASRFPYGEMITAEKLSMVERAEAHLHELGWREVRVRHHGNLARIEVPPAELPRLLEQADGIAAFLRRLGYLYVAVDLQGFRSGSLNATLSPQERAAAR